MRLQPSPTVIVVQAPAPTIIQQAAPVVQQPAVYYGYPPPVVYGLLLLLLLRWLTGILLRLTRIRRLHIGGITGATRLGLLDFARKK